MIRDHGQSRKYYHQMEGYNGRLDAMQAAFLRIKLRHLDAWTASRRAAARRYNELLVAAWPQAARWCCRTSREWSQAVYHLYVVRTPDRDALAKALHEKAIQTGFHYPVPLHLQECYRHWGYEKGSLPVTERAASRVSRCRCFRA